MVTTFKLLAYFSLLLAVIIGCSLAAKEISYRFPQIDKSLKSPVSFDGMIIDSIIIDNRNIYDTNDADFKGFLFKTANRLHIKTRKKIIHRELLFKPGEPFSSTIAEELTRNLRQRYPLNESWIEVTKKGDNRVIVRVITIDRWSLVGGLRSFSHEGKETTYRIGFEERNFFGRAQLVSVDYYARNKREDYFASDFRDSRFLGMPLSLSMHFRNNPEDRLKQVVISRPFYNLAQRFSFLLAVSDAGGKPERFLDGLEVAQWKVKSDRAFLSMAYRFGPADRKITFKGNYSYVSQRNSEQQIFDQAAFALSDFPVDSIYHQFDIEGIFQKQEFIVLHRINGFAYNEDFVLGPQISILYGRAYRPEFNDYLYNVAQLAMRTIWRSGSHLVFVDYDRRVWFQRSEFIRKRGIFSFRLYNYHFQFMTMALRTYFTSDKSSDPNPLLLGGKNGLRGYSVEHTSGDKLHVINIEGRFFPDIEIMSVKFGSVIFLDAGRTWKQGEALQLVDYNASIGIGLRVSLERLDRNRLIRIDGALTRAGHWEVLIGTGQYF